MKHLTRSLGLLLLSVIAWPLTATAKVGDVGTWMSKSYAGDGGNANEAWLDTPGGFAADAQCNLYIADGQNYVVRKIASSTNTITTLLGSGHYGTQSFSPTLNARQYQFKIPNDLDISATGKLYVTDTDNGTITVSSTTVYPWIKGLKQPLGTAVDGTYLYIADTGHHQILRAALNDSRPSPLAATSLSKIATVPGPGKMDVVGDSLYLVYNNGTSFGRVTISTGVLTPLKTGLADAEGVRVFNGLVYLVSGYNGLFNEIWKYNPTDGSMARIQNVPETEWYNHASDILFCGGKMYILFRAGSSVFTADVDGSNRIKIAGKHRWGDRDGLRSVALLGRPVGLTLSKDRNKLYILENHKVKELNLTTNVVRFIAGYANDNFVDGVGAAARISGATQMAISLNGQKLYLADRNNNRIRALDIPTQRLTTLSGAGRFNMFNNQSNGYAEGAACTATYTAATTGCAYFNRPTGITLSLDGHFLYVADSSNNRIRRVEVGTGKTTLVAGGSSGFVDGVGSAAKFNGPTSLLLSKDGKSLFVVDRGNHAIRQVTLATKRVTKVVGRGRAGYLNGDFSAAFLSYPDTLTYGSGNSLFLSEVGSQRIRWLRLDSRRISNLTGSGIRGNLNGPAAVARLNNPRGLVIVGNKLLVADSLNDLIRSVNLQ